MSVFRLELNLAAAPSGSARFGSVTASAYSGEISESAVSLVSRSTDAIPPRSSGICTTISTDAESEAIDSAYSGTRRFDDSFATVASVLFFDRSGAP